MIDFQVYVYEMRDVPVNMETRRISNCLKAWEASSFKHQVWDKVLQTKKILILLLLSSTVLSLSSPRATLSSPLPPSSLLPACVLRCLLWPVIHAY